MRKFDFTFNSENAACESKFQIASGYISETAILFEKENIVAVVYAKGCVEFYNTDDQPLASATVPENDGGKGVYQDICCFADGNTITLKFPIYEWIDNYPNCDGEHDRWDTKIIDYYTVVFNLSDNSVS